MNSAVVVAGGSSSRFGGKIPKQFIQINGTEILAYSVNTLINHPQVNEVVIVCHKDWMDHVSVRYPDCKVIEGGIRRQDSSLNGINFVSSKTENVLIHDAARPLVTEHLITDCLAALENADVSAPILATSNSLIKWDGKSATYIDRSEIHIVQTPQCFKKEIILQALKSDIPGTDELGIILRLFPNIKLKFVCGNIRNIKITTPFDLNYFKTIQR